MGQIRMQSRAIIAVGMVILALVMPRLPAALADTHLVYPPNAIVFGKTYSEWTAEWLQWVLAIPIQANPSADRTGRLCGVQQTRPVFFLGTTVEQIPFNRECTVPSGVPLFASILGTACSDVFPPPFFGSTDAELLACAQAQTDFVDVSTLRASVDGVNIAGLQNFRFASPPFNFRQPAQNNLFGLPGVTSGRAVADGYSLILKPLAPGRHAYHAEGAFTDGFFQNLTVILNAR